MSYRKALHLPAWLFARLRPRQRSGGPDVREFDPFTHPQIARMNLAELADLPFDAYALPPAPAVTAGAMAGRKRRAAAKPGNACIGGVRPL